MIDLVAIQRRTRKLRQRLGAAASRVSAAMLMLIGGGLPVFNAGTAEAAKAGETFQIAAAPIVRVVDANSGNGVSGVQIKSMDEQLLGVTDATGQATLSDEYTETDLLSLEKDGYQMYLLDRAQLSSRNIVSMKPIDDAKTAAKPAAKPTPRVATAPRVTHTAPNHTPKLTAPKPPAMPKSPQIRLPLKPRVAASAKPVVQAAAPTHDTHHVAPKHAAPAHNTAHVAPKHAAPTLPAPKMAAAHTDAGHALPSAPHKPAYKPKPVTAAHAPEAHDSADHGHSVMVPKRVPAARTADANGESGGYYQVRRGDTLSKIAYRQLGSASLWPELHAANRGAIKNPHFIRIGQRIALPKGAAHMAKSHTTTTRHYVVKAGDSLSRIAGEQLGDVQGWQKIFQKNRTAIANPRFIYPGQRLTLPG